MYLLLGFAWHIAGKVARIGGRIEIETRWTSEHVSNDSQTRWSTIQTPVVLLAIPGMLEEALLLALEVRARIRSRWWWWRGRSPASNVKRGSLGFSQFKGGARRWCLGGGAHSWPPGGTWPPGAGWSFGLAI